VRPATVSLVGCLIDAVIHVTLAVDGIMDCDTGNDGSQVSSDNHEMSTPTVPTNPRSYWLSRSNLLFNLAWRKWIANDWSSQVTKSRQRLIQVEGDIHCRTRRRRASISSTKDLICRLTLFSGIGWLEELVHA